MVSGHAQRLRMRRPGCDQDRVVAVGLEPLEISNGHTRRDLHSDCGHIGYVLVDHLGRKPICGDRQTQEAAGDGSRLEDANAVTPAGELPGRRETGGPGTHDRDALPVALGNRHVRAVPAGIVPFGDEPLESPDGDRPFQFAPCARAFTRRVTRPAESPYQRCRLQHKLECFFVEPATDQRHVAVSLDAGRARIDARRGPRPLDQGLLRDCLREGYVGSPAGDHLTVPLVRDRHSAGLLTLPAARAGGQVHEARLAMYLDVEDVLAIA